MSTLNLASRLLLLLGAGVMLAYLLSGRQVLIYIGIVSFAGAATFAGTEWWMTRNRGR